MPLTKLDAIPALVVIDLQKGIVAMPAVHPVGEIIARTAQLARVFRERGLPIVLVRVTGAGARSSAHRCMTARSAWEYGYNVVPVVDAMTDRDDDAHRHSVEKIFPRLGERATTGDVLKLLREVPAR
jgi:nicotinamidase-related amidase